jgi:hypothetical protein
MWGMFDETVLKALGDTKPFLIIAALAGLIYCMHALAPSE